MIEEKTVFILGAGASCPYGFPDGKKLGEKICSNLLSDIEQFYQQNDFVEMNYDYAIAHSKELIDKFSKAYMSIDLFLSLNHEFLDMGKCAIIFRIISAEKNSEFRKDIDIKEHDWYSHIKNKLIKGMTKKEDYSRLSENNATFITFNYDRSFEYYLHDSIIHSFNKIPEVKINEQLRQIKIFHLFGQLGGLEWQDMDLTYRYGTDPYSVDLIKLSKKLNIIYEQEEITLLKEAKNEISKASRIFFLGFGFLEENLKLLDIPNILNRSQKIFGTGYGLYPEEIEEIKKSITPKVPDIALFQNRNIHIEKCDCLELLRKYLR